MFLVGMNGVELKEKQKEETAVDDWQPEPGVTDREIPENTIRTNEIKLKTKEHNPHRFNISSMKRKMPPGRLPREEFRARPAGQKAWRRSRTRWRDFASWLAWDNHAGRLEGLEKVEGMFA